jgi:diacylglycerol kinase (ATP)
LLEFLSSRGRSFIHAFAGWWYVIHTQKNAWVHAIGTVLVLSIAAWLSLPAWQFAILILTICVVWTSEFINSALEAVVDLASPYKHPLAKVGKDVGAAAVLIAALSSILVGILLLGPPLLEKIAQLKLFK